ncbi:MAG: hypothetical protein A2Y33_08565 [Spirochaetes bacterium GWF1_51_8]|nr:MAG: hypothetical protein A2Y33_08565 [Spirochaetes bacterium GWF1_51_8]
MSFTGVSAFKENPAIRQPVFHGTGTGPDHQVGECQFGNPGRILQVKLLVKFLIAPCQGLPFPFHSIRPYSRKLVELTGS